MAFRKQRRLMKLPALDARNAVMLRQATVEHREVRRDKVRQAQIVFQYLLEKQLGLADHRHLQQVIKLRIQDVARLHYVDLARSRPFASYLVRDSRRSGVSERSLHLLAEHLWLALLLLFGEREQLIAGHCAPEEVRQPAGQGK